MVGSVLDGRMRLRVVSACVTNLDQSLAIGVDSAEDGDEVIFEGADGPLCL
jgi:hypothetical protein